MVSLAETQSPRESSPFPAQKEHSEYSREARPLVSYALLVGLYQVAFLTFLFAARKCGRPIPSRIAWSDVILLGVATFKLSRLLSKDLVTSFLRAPFTTFRGMAGEGEVDEEPRGEGMQRALGELLTCPFCLAPWVAAFLAYGLVFSPPLTRLAAGVLAVQGTSDLLQFGFSGAAGSAEPGN
jgi:hypothetical protein